MVASLLPLRSGSWGRASVVLLACLLTAGPAQAQAPATQAPQTERPTRSDSERLERSELNRLPPDERRQRAREGTLRPPDGRALRTHAGPSKSVLQAKTTPANLFTRAGAGLTGVFEGSSSLGDVNGDGSTDLLITGQVANRDKTATLYLGDGTGGFSKAGAGLTGVFEGSSSLGDVDGDGDTDLLITGQDANFDKTATLYLRDDQGEFSKANIGLTGVSRGSSSIADVNGDDNPDLLITGQDTNFNGTATLYLGNGSGGFSKANANLTGVSSGSSSIGDVNGDGNPDLLITGRDANRDPTATLYLGNGSGGFSKANANLTGVYRSSSSIADVDGDNNPDLLITGRGTDRNQTATLYLGNGSGGFSKANANLTGVSSGSSSIGDVDGDDTPDLLVTGFGASGGPAATLYLGDGTGGFSKAGAGLTGVSGSSSSLGDVDGDGDSDLVVVGEDELFGTRSARVYVNRTVQTPPNRSPVITSELEGFTLAPGRTVTRLVEAGDPDGDALSLSLTQGRSVDGVSLTDAGNGVAEIEFTPPSDRAGQSISFTVEASDGNGGAATESVTMTVGDDFALVGAGLTGVENSSPSLGDVNGDGNTDLLITGRDANRDPTATLYLGNGSGGFSEANANLTGVSRSSSSLGDVNGDGNTDLLITGDDGSTETATLYLRNGTGGFSKANANLTGVSDGSSSLGDVNGDGNTDLLITGRDADNAETAMLYLGDGQGGFSEAGAGLTGVSSGSSSLGDVDGDGNPDLLITGYDGNTETATLYLGDGTGGFSKANANLTGVSRSSSSLGDVDGDGNTDLLITGDDGSTETATLYLGDGQGGFSEAGAGLTGVESSSSSLGDVDNDGTLDLVIIGRDARRLPTTALYENLTSEDFRAATASQTVSSDGLASFADTGVSVDFSGTSGSGDVIVQRFENRPRLPLGVLEANVSTYRFVVSAGGNLTFNENTEVRLDVSMLGGVEDASNVTVYKRAVRDNGLFQAVPTTYNDGAGELVAEVGAFSEFVLASDSDQNPLPVELASFDAAARDGSVQLSWTTASETNNAGFRVQRKGEGAKGREGAWTPVGHVDGSGTTTEAQSYRFTDGDLPYEADVLIYRLKQVDTDGSANYSKTVTVERGVSEVQLLGTAPNPARQRATVRYALPEEQEAEIRLYNVLGQQVRTLVSSSKEGRHEQTLDVSGLSSGVYFLRLRVGGTTRTQKMTVVQ